MNNIPPVQGTNNIRYADFVYVNTGTSEYRFSTAPTTLTIPEVSSAPFNAVGQLIKVGDATRDIKSTANETTITLVGIDTAMLGFVLGQNIKGSQIQMWHGFFNEQGELLKTGGQGGLYQFFNGIINSFTISEEWYEDARMYVGLVTVSAASIQLILQNRTAGRYTNNNSWTFYNPSDTSMNRVAAVMNQSWYFGKKG